MRFLLAALVAIVVAVVACARAPVEIHAPPLPSAIAVDATAPAVDAEAPDANLEPLALDWTDPRVVDGLARDCRFTPAPPKRGADDFGERRGVEDALACRRRFYHEQSCIADPCYGEKLGYECRGVCEETCGGCAKGCVASCGTCKTTCTTDACRRACAESCATCHQTCLREVDRCTSGRCPGDAATRYQACRDKVRERWLANACPTACANYLGCYRACKRRAGDDEEKRFQCTQQQCDPDPKRTACLAACERDGGPESACLDACGEERCEIRLCQGARPITTMDDIEVWGGDSIDPTARVGLDAGAH